MAGFPIKQLCLYICCCCEVTGVQGGGNVRCCCFLIFYLFIFRERGREGEREGEKHQCVVVSHAPHTGDLAHNQACALTEN